MFDNISGSQPSVRDRLEWLPLTALSLAVFVVAMDNTVLNVALPSIARDLSATTSDLQWVVTAYSLVFGGMLLTSGSLGDRLGRRRMLIGGLAGVAALSALAPLVVSVWQLVALRAATGLAAAFVMPSTLAALSVRYEGTLRARALGLVGSVGAAAFVGGPILGGWLLEHFRWSVVLVVNVPLAILALALGLRTIDESVDGKARRSDLPGAVLSVAAMTSLLWGLNRGAQEGWSDRRCVLALVVAVGLLVAFLVRERSSTHPMLDLRLIARRGFAGPALAQGIVMFAVSGLMFLLTTHLQVVRGWTPLQAGLAGLPLVVAMGLSEVLVRATEHWHRADGAALGLGLLALGLPPIALWGQQGYAAIAAGYVLCGVGLRLTMQTVAVAMLDALPRSQAGLASALNDTLQEIGSAFGVAAVATIVTSTMHGHAVFADPDGFEDGMRTALWISAALVALSALTARRTMRATLPDHGDAHSAGEGDSGDGGDSGRMPDQQAV